MTFWLDVLRDYRVVEELELRKFRDLSSQSVWRQDAHARTHATPTAADAALQLVRAMATLSRADRGGEAEVRAGAKLDSESAANWLAKREAALAENENRRQRREGCLRDSAMTGAAAGTVGASLAFGILRRPAGTGPFRSLLGINVSGKAMGGAMQSFVVWMGFFMPFMLVSNVTRWRCQKAGIASSAIPRSSPAA